MFAFSVNYQGSLLPQLSVKVICFLVQASMLYASIQCQDCQIPSRVKYAPVYQFLGCPLQSCVEDVCFNHTLRFSASNQWWCCLQSSDDHMVPTLIISWINSYTFGQRLYFETFIANRIYDHVPSLTLNFLRGFLLVVFYNKLSTTERDHGLGQFNNIAGQQH